MKKFIIEFKEFISRGNVVTMAVGIIIGGAFTSIVNSLVKDVITPLIGVILGGIDFSGLIITAGDSSIGIGSFINQVVSFFLSALVLFIVIKTFNRFQKKKDEEPEKQPSEEVILLREIRDLLKKEDEDYDT